MRKVWRVAAVITLVATAMIAALLASCSLGSGNKNGKSGPLPPSPQYYDMSMYGFGFGVATYDYTAGQWEPAANTPFGSASIQGAAFHSPEYGFAWTNSMVFAYNGTGWSNATPSDMPNGAIVDGVFNTKGGCWLAVTDSSSQNGWLVYLAPDGTHTVVAGQGLFSSNPVAFNSVFVVKGDDTGIHALAALDGNYEHLRWDGQNVQQEVVIPIQYTEPSADDDASPTPQLSGDVLTMRAAPDGTMWAAGWDTKDGYGRGVFWRRDTNPVNWTRLPTTASSGCLTTTVTRLAFAADDGAGYAIGSCSHAQIYRKASNSEWGEMNLPGTKSGYDLRDLAMRSDLHGWAVGYTAETNGPLLLQRAPEGWLEAKLADSNAGDRMNAAVMFSIQPVSVGDDDVSPDDDASPADDDASPTSD